MNRIFTLLMAFVFVLSAHAQSDFEIAQSFMTKKGITLVNNTKVFTRATNTRQYSLFKSVENKAFVIVMNGMIVGYSTENGFNEENMLEVLEEVLEVHSRKRAASTDNLDWFVPRNVNPIEPLIKTHWGQVSPYNDQTPDKSGICVTIAYAQLLHFFRIPQTYIDIEFDYDKWGGHIFLPKTTFDHDKILNDYKVESTEEERNEVAKFCNYIMNTFTYFVDVEKVFNISITQYGYYMDYNSRYDIIDPNLEDGIPLWCLGNNHAYLLDGRDSEGRYHFNFGWSGHCDGYYAIPDSFDMFEDFPGLYSYARTYLYLRIAPNDWTSSINRVKQNKVNNGGVYTLQGVKVGKSLEGLPKGIYIKDGKKVVVR